jgi:hypothetical protein
MYFTQIQQDVLGDTPWLKMACISMPAFTESN